MGLYFLSLLWLLISKEALVISAASRPQQAAHEEHRKNSHASQIQQASHHRHLHQASAASKKEDYGPAPSLEELDIPANGACATDIMHHCAHVLKASSFEAPACFACP